MAGDDFQLLNGLAQHGGSTGGDKAVRGAVEPVTAHLVPLIVFIGDGIGVGHIRHGLMERGVKNSNLRHGITQNRLAGVDANEVGGVVQRGQRIALFNGFHHLIGDEDGGCKGLAAVNHAVPHSVDLAHGGKHTVFSVHQSVQNGLNGLGMGGHRHVNGAQGLLALHLRLIGELAVNTNALAQALCQQNAGRGVKKLIFQGRTACVDNQNIHVNDLLIVSAYRWQG